jgi:hypothetical protein
VERRGDDYLTHESTALRECILELGDDDLMRSLRAGFQSREERIKLPLVFSTLQGRCFAPLRAGVALRFGLTDEATALLRDGLAWCEEQRCPADAASCRTMLAGIRS